MKSAFACKLHIIFQCIIDPCIEFKLVRLEGIEPPTFGTGIQRSIQLSYRRIFTLYEVDANLFYLTLKVKLNFYFF